MRIVIICWVAGFVMATGAQILRSLLCEGLCSQSIAFIPGWAIVFTFILYALYFLSYGIYSMVRVMYTKKSMESYPRTIVTMSWIITVAIIMYFVSGAPYVQEILRGNSHVELGEFIWSFVYYCIVSSWPWVRLIFLPVSSVNRKCQYVFSEISR